MVGGEKKISDLVCDCIAMRVAALWAQTLQEAHPALGLS